jgi:hypothetical protein
MKELLLLGGSHLPALVSHLKNIIKFNRTLPSGYIPKWVACTDLDVTLSLKSDNQSNLHCKGVKILEESCRKEYGAPVIPYDPERIICLCIGSWHHACDDPIWLTHYPAEVEPDLTQTTPISTFEVINRISPEVFLRVQLLLNLISGKRLNLFLVVTPPTILCQLAALDCIPPRTLMYVTQLCYSLFVRSLLSLKIQFVDISEKVLDNDKFLRYDYCINFGDSHANSKYGQVLWENISNLLETNNWDPQAFRIK